MTSRVCKARIMFLCICFCGMTQFVGCMQQKEAPENLSYAAEQIPVTYKVETELLKKYPDMLKGEAVEIE